MIDWWQSLWDAECVLLTPELLRLRCFSGWSSLSLLSGLTFIAPTSRRSVVSLRSAFPVAHTSHQLLWLLWFHRGLSNRWREEATLISSKQKKKKTIFLSSFFPPDYFLLSWSLYLSCLLPPLIAFLYFLLLFTSLHLPSCLLPKIEPSRSLPLVHFSPPQHSSFSSAPLSLHSSTPWLSLPRRIAATQQSSLISRDAVSQQSREVIAPDSWWFIFLPSSPPVSRLSTPQHLVLHTPFLTPPPPPHLFWSLFVSVCFL